MKVRDVVRLLKQDGWRLDRARGSHRQYKHPAKPGVVTVPGKPGDDFGYRHPQQRSEACRIEEMKKYLIVVEKTGTRYSAYSPDLDGCVATGKNRQEVESQMQEAIAFHLEGIARSGEPIPEPRTYSTYVEVPAQAG